MFSTAQGEQWTQPPTKTPNDSGHELSSVTPTTAGNGKDHYEEMATDSSTHKENTGQYTGSHTSSQPSNGRQWSDINATTADVSIHTTLKVEHKQTT